MAKEKRKSINIAELFEIKNDIEFLGGLDNWIGRKMPSWFNIPMNDFQKLVSEMDIINKDLDSKGLEPEMAFNMLTQAVNRYMPAPTPIPDDLFNFHENIFRAVFYMDSYIYNDGADSYFTSTNERDYQYTLEGLSIIGAVDVKGQLELLCLSLFGKKYPATEKERNDLLDEDDDRISSLLDKFSSFYSKQSDNVKKQLAKWARENRNMFL